MGDDHWHPPDHPTKAEVREIVRTIIEKIENAPDWAPKPKQPIDIEPPDESWPGWAQ